MKATITQRVDTGYFTILLREDGIIHVHFKADTVITVPVQDELLASYRKVTIIKRPIMFSADEFVSLTKEARQNALKMEPEVPGLASAIVVRNLAQRIIAGYYYRYQKPMRPYRIFTDLDKAAMWLNENYGIED